MHENYSVTHTTFSDSANNKLKSKKQQYCYDYKIPNKIQYIQPILHSLLTLTVWSRVWIRERQWYDNPNDLYTVTPTVRNCKTAAIFNTFQFQKTATKKSIDMYHFQNVRLSQIFSARLFRITSHLKNYDFLNLKKKIKVSCFVQNFSLRFINRQVMPQSLH